MPLERWQQIMELNATAPFICSQVFGREMIKQKRGKIINIASIAGLQGRNPGAYSSVVYSTSKGALVNFTRDLAVKWAQHNINVNCICPGFFVTPINQKLFERSPEPDPERDPARAHRRRERSQGHRGPAGVRCLQLHHRRHHPGRRRHRGLVGAIHGGGPHAGALRLAVDRGGGRDDRVEDSAAWYVTGSVGLLSDALESLINLAAALLLLSMLRLAATPPDATHPYGRFKAEYFASGIEGALIVFAAASIMYAAAPRLLEPASARCAAARHRAVRRGNGDQPRRRAAAHFNGQAPAQHRAGGRRPPLDDRRLDLRRRDRGRRARRGHRLGDPRPADRARRGGAHRVDRHHAHAPLVRRAARRGDLAGRARGDREDLRRVPARAMASSSTRCSPARRARGASSRSTCWCPTPGRWTARTSSPRRSRSASARWCRTRSRSPTSSRSRSPRPTTTSSSSADAGRLYSCGGSNIPTD